MFSKLRKENKGFTIIEVLIVLAIAGLIMLIVFLAVPALQRNSRNTQRKNDVAAILAAVSEFSNNNNGLLPNGVWTNAAGTATAIGAAGTTSSQGKVGYFNLGIGTGAGFINKVANGTVVGVNVYDSAAEDQATVATATACGPTGGASIPGPARSVTVVYEIENGSGTYAQQCQAS